MEIQFEHDHVLTFCDQNEENFSQILLMFSKRDERNRRKVDGDLEVAELDDEEDYAEFDDEEDYAESSPKPSQPQNLNLFYFRGNSDYPKCLVCYQFIFDGPVYFCEMCDGVWVHKFCASLPREIRAHPLHLQHDHPLTLLAQHTDELSYLNKKTPICDGCMDIISTPNYYECAECGLQLDSKCALTPDNDDLQQITTLLSPDTKTQISHDSHHHTLFLFNSRSRQIAPFAPNSCMLCDGELLDLTYGCFRCSYYLHKRCVELTQQECKVQHPCHSHHPFSIEYDCGVFICDQCRDLSVTSFMATCKDCGFKIDSKCALSPDNGDLQQITTLLSLDTKTQISHDSHHHTLFLFNSRSRKKPPFSRNSCMLCDGELLDLTYGCFRCDYYLHKRCVEISQQECKVQHPCHSHHPFSIEYDCGVFICDQCRDLSASFMAICKACGFKMDFKCAFLRDITIQRSIGDEVKIQISIFKHTLHTLSFFNYSPGSGPENTRLTCAGCKLPLSGPSYGCLERSVYLHKSCAEMPQIIQHPYHHFHKLYLQASVDGYCSACRRLQFYVQSYRCYRCPSFVLDPQCAINNLGVTSALKNKEYHQHDLYYFVAPDWLYDSEFRCNICRQNCKGSFYICLECKHRPYFHMECIGIPKEVKHDYHIHPLTLMDPLTEDDIDDSKDQYYCYTCENKRNPRYYAYSCQQCANTGHIFTAHIECVLSSELNEIEHTHMIKEDEEDSHEKYPDSFEHPICPSCMKQRLIKDKINDHVLNNFRCYICKKRVESCTSYGCSYCQIYLDKKCAELPIKIEHNLHEHPLSILGGKFSGTFICDGCHVYHDDGMGYCCHKCRFFLDRECALAISSIDDHYQTSNNNGREATISHLFHKHKLRFAYFPEKFKVHCSVCSLQISGPTYCCYECHFFLHDSCSDELEPQSIQHPFHTQHPLHFTRKSFFFCAACKQFPDIGYECARCDFGLHIKCAKYLTSGLQYKRHEHKLFCFVAEDINDPLVWFRCNHCGQECKGNASFYHCLDCDFNLHIECIPIPKIVKSLCHVHPLTLMDSIIEKGRDEYYCHACENLRNPKHAAYYCKSCYYTAHIGCVLDEEEGEIEVLSSL